MGAMQASTATQLAVVFLISNLLPAVVLSLFPNLATPSWSASGRTAPTSTILPSRATCALPRWMILPPRWT